MGRVRPPDRLTDLYVLLLRGFGPAAAAAVVRRRRVRAKRQRRQQHNLPLAKWGNARKETRTRVSETCPEERVFVGEGMIRFGDEGEHRVSATHPSPRFARPRPRPSLRSDYLPHIIIR